MNAPDSVSPIEAHLGYWLRVVSNHVSHGFRLAVEARGVTVAEWVVLRKLMELGTCSPGRMAEALALTRGAISKLNDRLAAKGLVHITANPADGRGQIMQLTETAARLVPGSAALADANDAGFFGILDGAEGAELRRLLDRLVEAHGLRAPALE